MTLRSEHRWAITLAWLLIAAAATVAGQGQDSLARAKDFYASASYEEALQVLDKLHNSTPPIDSTEVSAYQVFCLVALGRSDEATHAIETMVKADPLYRPSDALASPRVRTFFENVRRPLLPDVVRDSYAKGKDAFANKNWSAATAEFDQVIALIDEMGSSAEAGLSDLRTLAAGFRDLSKAADTPPAAPAPTSVPPAETPSTSVPAQPSPATVASAASTPLPIDPNHIYTTTDVDVVKPIAVAKEMPLWNPANPVDKLRDFRGTIELIVDETGKVVSAAMLKTVNPTYDPQLLKAAAQWQFKPATRGGTPVKYRYAVDIHLGR